MLPTWNCLKLISEIMFSNPQKMWGALGWHEHCSQPTIGGRRNQCGRFGCVGRSLLHTQDVSCQAEGQVPSKWLGSFGVNQNLRCLLVEKRKASVFLVQKTWFASFLSSIPSSNWDFCVNKQIQPLTNSTFLRSFFLFPETNKHTNHGLLQLRSPPKSKSLFPPKPVWTEGTSPEKPWKTCVYSQTSQELKENLTDPNAPFGVDLLQLDMNFGGLRVLAIGFCWFRNCFLNFSCR